jgi:hypothetical protein
VFVTACCDLEQGKTKEDNVEQLDVATLITGPPHLPTSSPADAVPLLSAMDCVEPTSYRAALSIAQAPKWQTKMQYEYNSLLDNGTWELTDLPAGRAVVNNMWI